MSNNTKRYGCTLKWQYILAREVFKLRLFASFFLTIVNPRQRLHTSLSITIKNAVRYISSHRIAEEEEVLALSCVQEEIIGYVDEAIGICSGYKHNAVCN